MGTLGWWLVPPKARWDLCKFATVMVYMKVTMWSCSFVTWTAAFNLKQPHSNYKRLLQLVIAYERWKYYKRWKKILFLFNLGIENWWKVTIMKEMVISKKKMTAFLVKMKFFPKKTFHLSTLVSLQHSRLIHKFLNGSRFQHFHSTHAGRQKENVKVSVSDPEFYWCSNVNAVTHANQIIVQVVHPLFFFPSSFNHSVCGRCSCSLRSSLQD